MPSLVSGTYRVGQLLTDRFAEPEFVFSDPCGLAAGSSANVADALPAVLANSSGQAAVRAGAMSEDLLLDFDLPSAPSSPFRTTTAASAKARSSSALSCVSETVGLISLALLVGRSAPAAVGALESVQRFHGSFDMSPLPSPAPGVTVPSAAPGVVVPIAGAAALTAAAASCLRYSTAGTDR